MSKKKRNRILTDIELVKLHHSGKVYGFAGLKRVYAENAVPGETVDVQITGRYGDAWQGKAVSYRKMSDSRVEPVCKHFGLCGGCNWQHISNDYQLLLKYQLVTDAFEKNNVPYQGIKPVVPSPRQLFYRSRLEYSFSSRRWYYEGEGRMDDPGQRKAMGFHMADNQDKVVQVEECYLQPEPGFQIAKTVERFSRRNGFSFYDPKEQIGLMRSLVIRITNSGEVMLIVVFGEEDKEKTNSLLNYLENQHPAINSLYYTVTPGLKQNFSEGELVHFGVGAKAIFELCNGLAFRISPASFYQPNPLQAEFIYRKIVELAVLTGKERIYDLYCGIGTISLHLASKAMEVIGIEGSASSVEDARLNAELNRIANTRFICGDILETFTPAFVDEHGKAGLVVLDPPRSGTLIEIKKTILYADPAKIIYLSCNPLSLASDLRMLTIGYRITCILPFDMFPQTHQVETLVVLEKG